MGDQDGCVAAFSSVAAASLELSTRQTIRQALALAQFGAQATLKDEVPKIAQAMLQGRSLIRFRRQCGAAHSIAAIKDVHMTAVQSASRRGNSVAYTLQSHQQNASETMGASNTAVSAAALCLIGQSLPATHPDVSFAA